MTEEGCIKLLAYSQMKFATLYINIIKYYYYYEARTHSTQTDRQRMKQINTPAIKPNL